MRLHLETGLMGEDRCKEVERRFDEYVAKKKQEFAEAVKKQFAERLRNLGCGQEEINRCVAKVFIA
jgi:hypothetical protein